MVGGRGESVGAGKSARSSVRGGRQGGGHGQRGGGGRYQVWWGERSVSHKDQLKIVPTLSAEHTHLHWNSTASILVNQGKILQPSLILQLHDWCSGGFIVQMWVWLGAWFMRERG